jgi:hypothetical protein
MCLVHLFKSILHCKSISAHTHTPSNWNIHTNLARS